MKNLYLPRLTLNLVYLITVLFVFAAPVYSQDLGGGNTCVDKKVYNAKNRIITVAKTTKAIGKLKSKIKNQSGNKKAATKVKLDAQKSLKKLIKACNKGGTPVGGGSDVAQVFTDLNGGTFSGSYQGTHSLIGALNGTMTATFTQSGTTFSGTITFTNAPGTFIGIETIIPTLDFSRDVAKLTPPVSFTATTSNIGDMTITISANGAITADNSHQSVVVDFDAQHSANQIAGTLNGNYAGTFTSSFTLNR